MEVDFIIQGVVSALLRIPSVLERTVSNGDVILPNIRFEEVVAKKGIAE